MLQILNRFQMIFAQIFRLCSLEMFDRLLKRGIYGHLKDTYLIVYKLQNYFQLLIWIMIPNLFLEIILMSMRVL